VHPDVPVKTVQELIALARSKPDGLIAGSPGHGSAGRLAAELFSSMAKIKMVHVTYKGGAPAMTAVLGGHVDVASNPEFLREGSAIEDFMRPNRVVIGAETERSRELMTTLYRPLYLNETPIVVTNLETAELTKYASNAFLATKISFVNEISNLCESYGADQVSAAMAHVIDAPAALRSSLERLLANPTPDDLWQFQKALLVVGVTPGSPAAVAGLMVGDVLATFDGHAVATPEDLLELLVAERIGRTVALGVGRGPAWLEVLITVGERPTH